MTTDLAPELFSLNEGIRYVAVNQGGAITEMAQSPKHPTISTSETDRMEELIVNPAILEIARRRGEIDCDGLRYVIIRYGAFYVIVFPYKDGHLAVGLELTADPTAAATAVAEKLELVL